MSGKTLLTLIGILALASFLRLWEIKEIPPGLYPDEAMNGNNAVEAMARDGLAIFYSDNNGREGLFMNIQSLSIRYFGNEAWALRIVSAIFGILTVLGIFLLARKMYHPLASRNRIGLFAAFFLATSFWHINFSRIGFRAIMAPFFIVWGLYFLFRFYKDTGSTKSQIIAAALGGLFFGLGFHSYIAYRAAPLLLLLPFIAGWKKPRREGCFPCLSLIFCLFVVMAVMPLMLYFIDHPADFFGRTSQISVFSEASPAKALAINTVKTIGMFWIYGDPNWRHNLSGAPQLSLAVGLFFLAGILISLRRIFKKPNFSDDEEFNSIFLVAWLGLMLAPVAISSEGLPHALRAIIAIPPVMILSAYGLSSLIDRSRHWLHNKGKVYTGHFGQIRRINREVTFLIAVLLLSIAVDSYDKYFNKWANADEVYPAFNTRDWELAKYLNKVPDEIHKYIVVTGERLDPRVVTISSQSVLFGTGTFLPEERARKNFHYVSPDELKAEMLKNQKQWGEIVFLGEENIPLAKELMKKYPTRVQIKFSGIFLVLSISP